MGSPSIQIDGRIPPVFHLARPAFLAAARAFAAASAARIGGAPWREVVIHLVGNDECARVNALIVHHTGPTDVITQRYDSIPGEPQGLYGELFINTDRALAAAPHRAGWSPAKELILYLAHGMDHLSGADDAAPADYNRMRRRELKWMKGL